MKRAISILLAALLVILFVVSSVGAESEKIGSYTGNFQSLSDFSGDIGESAYHVSDGVLVNTSKSWQTIQYAGMRYSDFTLHTRIKVESDGSSATTRLFFGSNNAWIDRYYLQLDFLNGNVLLIDGRTGKDDTALSGAEVNLTAGEYASLTVIFKNGSIKVFINNALAIDTMIEVQAGLIGFTNTSWGSAFYCSDFNIDLGLDKDYDCNLNFADADAASFWTNTANYSFSNGAMVNNSAGWNDTTFTAGKYTNFKLKTTVSVNGGANAATRIAFSSNNNWLDRYYLHFDFANGLIILRDGTTNGGEADLTAVLAPISLNTAAEITVAVISNRVLVYLGDSTVPALDYIGLIVRSGSVGFINTGFSSSVTISSFAITDLDTRKSSSTPADYSFDGTLNGWVGDTGSYTVSNGLLINSTASWNGMLYADKSYEDFDLNATMRVDGTNGGSTRVAFGIGSGGLWADRYFLQLDTGGNAVYLFENDTHLASASVNFNLNKYFTLRLLYIDGSLNVYVNNQLVLIQNGLAVKRAAFGLINTVWGDAAILKNLSVTDFNFMQYDADLDGTVTVYDVIKVKNHLLNKEALTNTQITYVNAMGSISITDLLSMKDVLLG